MAREVPLVGAFCGGEIGPYVRRGYVGWSFSAHVQGASSKGRSTVSALWPAGEEPAADIGGSGDVENGVATCTMGGRVLRIEHARMQGFTSMYTALG